MPLSRVVRRRRAALAALLPFSRGLFGAVSFSSAVFCQEIEETRPSEASPATKILNAGQTEAKRYAADWLALIQAPLSWEAEDWQKAAAVALVLGGLMLTDKNLDNKAYERRGRSTDRVSVATTPLGEKGAFALAGALLLGGIVFQSENTREMGREAIEAGVLAGLLANALKPAGTPS